MECLQDGHRLRNAEQLIIDRTSGLVGCNLLFGSRWLGITASSRQRTGKRPRNRRRNHDKGEKSRLLFNLGAECIALMILNMLILFHCERTHRHPIQYISIYLNERELREP